MRIRTVLFVFCSAMALQVTYAQGGPPGGVEPGPKHDVEGRTYCSVLNWLNLIGTPSLSSERIDAGLVRRKVTFLDNGLWRSEPVSWLINIATDQGLVLPVNLENDPNAGQIEGPYSQSGSQVQVTFPLGETANWYVSKDGSVIHGSRIRRLTNNNGQQIGQNITWTLVEVDPGDTCAADVPGNYPAPQ